MKIDKVISTIEKYRMLSKGDKVAVGFSGGADSVCLLHILNELKEKYELELCACHVNHMLRGEEADRDERFCKDFCEKYGIQLKVLRVDVGKKAQEEKQSVELCARKIRYNFFKECIGENGKIATAHTLSDSLETALFNMIRGTALKGLCSIPETRENIIRPLIECTRQDVEEYCRENGLSFVTDCTNLTDEYARNRIRHHLIPQMQEENPALFKTYLSMHNSLSRDESFLNGFAEDILEKVKLEKGYDAKALANQHDSILLRCIVKLFSRYDIETDTAKINLVCTALKNGKGKINLKPDVYMTVKNGILDVEYEEKQEYFERPLIFEKEIEVFEGKKFIAKLEKITSSKIVNQNTLKKYIDCDKIGHNVVVRQRKDGDRVRLTSNKMTKSLKKLFNERKIPKCQRDRKLLISDENGIVWVEGFGTDERCAVDEKTQTMAIIEIEDRMETK